MDSLLTSGKTEFETNDPAPGGANHETGASAATRTTLQTHGRDVFDRNLPFETVLSDPMFGFGTVGVFQCSWKPGGMSGECVTIFFLPCVKRV